MQITTHVEGSTENPKLKEIEDSSLAMAIELLTATGEGGKTYRTYTLEFTARRHPQDDGSCIVLNVFRASWPYRTGEPKWKQLARKLLGL